jgi:hypothetical protein
LPFSRSFTISSCQFLERVALFLKTEMNNPSSNFTCSKMKCISFASYKTWSVIVSYATQVSKTATLGFQWLPSWQYIHRHSVFLAALGRQRAVLFSCKIWAEVRNLCYEENYVQQKVDSSKETSRSWYHAIDRTYADIVKFERRLSIQFVRKKEKQFFSKGMTQPFFFFVKNGLFLRTEMDNLRSNLIRI